jgi:hypothetical protein
MRSVTDRDLHARVISARSLVYTNAVAAGEDRPPHVRAASAIAAAGDTLYVVQDDAGFIACVRGDEVTSIALPRGADGRRRFEARLGNKLDKLDLESCVIVGDELWAFGSGTIPIREHVVRMSLATHAVRVDHEATLYARLHEAVGGAINIEGVAQVGDELWFFHRGNTSERDAPAIVRMDRGWNVRAIDRVDLGRASGVSIGFTDASAIDDVVVFIAAAEASANAIDDGVVLARMIGVVDRDGVRTAPLPVDKKPEGLALRGLDHAWITVDPDDPDAPTTLYEVALDGIKASK